MNILSDLTYKIAAYKTDVSFNMDEAVDWATEMIELGHESDSLFIIAGLSKPISYFEAERYLIKTLGELNIKQQIGDRGIICYGFYYIKKIANGADVIKNLSLLMSYIRRFDDNHLLFDFNLLYWAWSDLDYGMEHQSYWPDANKDNIEQIVIAVANDWIGKNANPLLS